MKRHFLEIKNYDYLCKRDKFWAQGFLTNARVLRNFLAIPEHNYLKRLLKSKDISNKEAWDSVYALYKIPCVARD